MKRILKVVLIFSILMMVLFGGYLYLSYEKSQSTDTQLLEQSTSQYQNPLQLKDGRVDDVSINLIYYVSEEDYGIKEAVLEILNCKQETLSYIVIPANTQISINSRIYQKMMAVNPKIPQYFLLDHMKSSINHKKWAAYGQLLIDSLFDIDTSYYTVVYGAEDTFEEHLNSVVSTLTDRASIKDYIKTAYKNKTIKSNLSKSDKLEYLDYYAALSMSQVQFYDLPGTASSDTFEFDSYQTGILITELSQGIQ